MQSRRGRPKSYGVGKREHKLSLTDEAWESLKTIAKQAGYKTPSELNEAIGRGEVSLIHPKRPADKLE